MVHLAFALRCLLVDTPASSLQRQVAVPEKRERTRTDGFSVFTEAPLRLTKSTINARASNPITSSVVIIIAT